MAGQSKSSCGDHFSHIDGEVKDHFLAKEKKTKRRGPRASEFLFKNAAATQIKIGGREREERPRAWYDYQECRVVLNSKIRGGDADNIRRTMEITQGDVREKDQGTRFNRHQKTGSKLTN